MIKPPSPSLTVRLFRRSFGWTTALSLRQALPVVAGLFLLVAVLDWLTGRTVSLSLGYLCVIALAAWTMKERAGFLLVLLSIAASQWINGWGTAHPNEMLPPGPIAAFWNSASRAVAAALIVMLVSTLRHMIETERWRAGTDLLTGALNKAAFVRQLAQVATAAGHDRTTLLLFYMDLDGFKEVNDHHGHAAGDEVLRAFAHAARARIRQGDFFGRIGGDEFAALIRLPAEADGTQVAETLHARLSDALRDTGHAVTCSMGVLELDARLAAAEPALIEMADAVMYEVKRSGKNALRIAHLAPPQAPMRFTEQRVAA